MVPNLCVEAQEFGFAFHQLQRDADKVQEYLVAVSPLARLVCHFEHQCNLSSAVYSQQFGFARRQIPHVLKKRF